MKIERSTVTKLTITGAKALDPITVYAEDIGPRQGKIIIECYGRSWSAYWGGCGDKGVAAFFCSARADYIADCLDRGIESSKYSAPDAPDELRRIVIERRRRDSQWRTRASVPERFRHEDYDPLDKEAARELWDRIEETTFYDDPSSISNIICDVVGHDEWWHAIPTTPNPDYVYLCRIIRAVQEAFRQIDQPEAVPA